MRWIAEFIGYPADCGGLLVSGGNMANMVCFLGGARSEGRLERARAGPGWRRRTHAARLLLGGDAHVDQQGGGLSRVSAPRRFDSSRPTTNCGWTSICCARQIDADAAGGDIPFLVVGTAGSVSTGAIDPLAGDCRVCREHDLWFHVDGAYGGFAAAVPGAPARCAISSPPTPSRSIRTSGSTRRSKLVARWCGGPSALRDAFTYHPPYYHFGEQATNYVDYGPQNSRGFRALKVWLALRQAGAAGYRAMIAEDMALSRAMAAAVDRHAELELVSQALSITTFRYVPADLRSTVGESSTERHLDTLNRDVARSPSEERRSVRVECGRERPLRAARVHRELPHDTIGC